jgi:hypothetical protein
MSRIPLATVLFLGIGTACTFAQAPANSSGDQGPDSVVQQSSSHPEDAMQAEKSQKQFTGLLNGTGLISMDSDNRLIFSSAAGGGWDSNPLNSPDSVSSSLYSLSPYIAFHGVSAKSKFIVQYQPTFLGYPSGTYERQTIHTASVQADGSLSERLQWKMNINGSYGQNGARFAGPLQSVAVGEVPGTATSTASYLPDSGSITYVFSSFETDYRKSERGTAVFSLSNSYNRVTGYDQAGGSATGRLHYSYDLSPTLSLMIYGQASHFYGDLNCEGVGAGGGVNWRLGMNTTLTLEAGPQISTAACGDQQGYSYALEYGTRLSNRAQFYLSANRLPMVSYLGPGAWQRGASAGMQYQVTPLALLRADVGYSSSTALVAVSSYSGISVNVSYDVQLKHGFALSYGYRGYFADSGGTGYSRSLAQVSLKWISNSGKIFQSQ